MLPVWCDPGQVIQALQASMPSFIIFDACQLPPALWSFTLRMVRPEKKILISGDTASNHVTC